MLALSGTLSPVLEALIFLTLSMVIPRMRELNTGTHGCISQVCLEMGELAHERKAI